MSRPRTSEVLGDVIVPVINRLQDIFAQVTTDFKLELPQVAVVGSQSSGKSSVLESLVGRDFLPRGPEICTRRPLVLQLVKSSPGTGNAPPPEYAEFLHCPGKRFFDDERIREEIQSETDRLTGTNKGISDRPIRLRITSPHVLTMTLVDLPGLSKVPVGDQPSDIEARTRAMILDYIKHDTCIILAVSPANADIVNSDALELARSVDPQGHRTIGVLTKLDIMDRGTDASAVLRNEAVPLRLGYIGVINRSQHDLNTGLGMADARAAEADFFAAMPEYADVQGQTGIGALALRLNHILVEHIRALLPSLRAHLEEAVDRRARELKKYGAMPPGNTSAARGALLLQLLDSYATRYAEMLDGRSEALPVSELAGGARIRHIYQDIFVKGLDELNPSSELTDEDVRTAIKNSGGVKGSLLIPEAPFELLVRRAISRLLTPALQCKEFVHGELLRIAGQSAPVDVARFPGLQRRLMTAVEDFINEGAAPAERMIRDLVACEHAYINTDHPSFVGGNRAIAQVLEQRCASSQSGGSDDEQGNGSEMPHSRSQSTGNLPQQSSGGLAHTRHSGRGTTQDASSAPARHPKVQLSNGVAGGIIPELFRPEDLLGSSVASAPQATVSASAPQPTRSEADAEEARSAGWLSGWLGGSKAAAAAAAPSASSRRSKSALHQPPSTLRVPTGTTEQEEVQVEVTRVLVESYFDIARKNLQDSVPKAIMHFLVGTVQRGMQQHLIHTLYREDLFEDMIRERPDVAAKREECRMALRALKEALSALETLPADLISRINAAGVAESEPVATPRRTASVNSSQFVVRSSSGALARIGHASPLHPPASAWG